MKTKRTLLENRDPNEKAAAQLLKSTGLQTVPVPVERIAKYLGAQVQFAPFDGDLSGLIYREEDEAGAPVATIIGINSSHAPTRRRFTLAHEIGHFVLGHLDGETLGQMHIDRKFKARDARSSQAVDPQEIDANAFAAALLMPAQLLREDFKKFRFDSIECFDYEDDELASALAERYNVSLQAMLIRLYRLGLVDPVSEQ
jgi:hypothetical protein